MKYWFVLVALFALGCGKDSPSAPTIFPANLIAQGPLNVNGCGAANNVGLINCLTFSGTVKNFGTGCAANIRGVTKTFTATSRTQVGSSEWNFAGRVRPNEELAYTGFVLVVSAPLTGGWVYTTEASWDNVACN